jgi:hypothetical protein
VCLCTSYSSRSLVLRLKHDFNAIAARLKNDYSTTLTWLHEKINWISTTHIRLWEVWLFHWERRTKKRFMQYYGSSRNNWSSESATSIQLRLHYVRVVSENGDSPRQYGGNCHVRGQQPRRPLTKLMTQLQFLPQQPHQHKWQMNFQVGFSMNYPMRLGLSDTTCPQRLREQNPVKVVFVLYDSEPSRSSSRKSPVFLLVSISLK